MPPFSTHRTHPAEIPRQMAMGVRAFADDPMMRACFPTSRIDPANPHAELEFRKARLAKRLENPAGHWWSTVDEGAGGRIVASSGWMRIELEKEKEKDPLDELPPCVDPDVVRPIEEALAKAKTRWVGEEPVVWYLAHMATDPEYQGKGLGKALVQWGCEQADEEGVPAYTEATAAGRPLYAKLGFELLEELTTDVMHEGSLVKYSIMLRKPKRKVEQMSED